MRNGFDSLKSLMYALSRRLCCARELSHSDRRLCRARYANSGALIVGPQSRMSAAPRGAEALFGVDVSPRKTVERPELKRAAGPGRCSVFRFETAGVGVAERERIALVVVADLSADSV